MKPKTAWSRGLEALLAAVMMALACILAIAIPSTAVTLTERSEAVLAACAALRAAGRQSPAVADAAREVLAARRARDAQRLVRALQEAERLLEPAGDVWDAVRIDLRAWELAEGRTISWVLWQEDRELSVRDPAALDEMKLYLRLKEDTVLVALGLRMPPRANADNVSRFLPPEGYAAWRSAWTRMESIVILAGRSLPVVPLLEPRRPDREAWRDGVSGGRGFRGVGSTTGGLDVPASWWPAGETWVIIAAGDSHPLSGVVADAGRIPVSSFRSVFDPIPEQLRPLEAMLQAMGDTPKIQTWRGGQVAVIYDPVRIIASNTSPVTLALELLTDAPERSGASGDGGRFSLVGRDDRALPRYAMVETRRNDGSLEQHYRVQLLPRTLLRVSPLRTLFLRMEPLPR